MILRPVGSLRIRRSPSCGAAFIRTSWWASSSAIPTAGPGWAPSFQACLQDDRSMGRSRGGLTSKIHTLIDADGRSIALRLTAGQVYDSREGEASLDAMPES